MFDSGALEFGDLRHLDSMAYNGWHWDAYRTREDSDSDASASNPTVLFYGSGNVGSTHEDCDSDPNLGDPTDDSKSVGGFSTVSYTSEEWRYDDDAEGNADNVGSKPRRGKRNKKLRRSKRTEYHNPWDPIPPVAPAETPTGPDFLSSLPLDVLTEIFCALGPRDLVTMSRINKAFRGTLFRCELRFIWTKALKREGIMPCPRGVNLHAWATLLAGPPRCQECEVVEVPDGRIDFWLLRRLCHDCLNENLISSREFKKEFPGTVTRSQSRSLYEGQTPQLQDLREEIFLGRTISACSRRLRKGEENRPLALERRKERSEKRCVKIDIKNWDRIQSLHTPNALAAEKRRAEERAILVSVRRDNLKTACEKWVRASARNGIVPISHWPLLPHVSKLLAAEPFQSRSNDEADPPLAIEVSNEDFSSFTSSWTHRRLQELADTAPSREENAALAALPLIDRLSRAIEVERSCRHAMKATSNKHPKHQSQWGMLPQAETELVKMCEKEPYSLIVSGWERDCWSCNRCAKHVTSPTSLYDVERHVKSRHNIAEPREGVDYFHVVRHGPLHVDSGIILLDEPPAYLCKVKSCGDSRLYTLSQIQTHFEQRVRHGGQGVANPVVGEHMEEFKCFGGTSGIALRNKID
ncbi:hypothetical protein LshimejAT787_0705270 [Lyophyllum shimeji]|uniref:F-box domain-containing protein n=1 Tax=Lyophyllum shimeji TaxID=47721 RepID=A0A9P3UP67_LYOSH|nr:hypothetical protein LshimejAT787_0705270 [Lyophyllum shimeji]